MGTEEGTVERKETPIFIFLNSSAIEFSNVSLFLCKCADSRENVWAYDGVIRVDCAWELMIFALSYLSFDSFRFV